MVGDHTPGSFFSDKPRPGVDPKLAKGIRYAFAIYAGTALIGVMLWAAIAGAAVDTTSHLRHQEAFSGFRTASTEQVR